MFKIIKYKYTTYIVTFLYWISYFLFLIFLFRVINSWQIVLIFLFIYFILDLLPRFSVIGQLSFHTEDNRAYCKINDTEKIEIKKMIILCDGYKNEEKPLLHGFLSFGHWSKSGDMNIIFINDKPYRILLSTNNQKYELESLFQPFKQIGINIEWQNVSVKNYLKVILT